MEKIFCKAVNLLMYGDCLIEKIQSENKQLEMVLEKIQSTREPMNACVVYEIFKDTACDIFQIIESVNALIGDIDEVALADELVQMREMLKSLLVENSNIERLFAAHTYCPALDKSE